MSGNPSIMLMLLFLTFFIQFDKRTDERMMANQFEWNLKDLDETAINSAINRIIYVTLVKFMSFL